jgi:hypothetical protein
MRKRTNRHNCVIPYALKLPYLPPNAVKAILANTAQRLTLHNILEQGNGYVNAEGAVRLARAI